MISYGSAGKYPGKLTPLKTANTGVDHNAPKPGARTEALAEAHQAALDRRKAG